MNSDGIGSINVNAILGTEDSQPNGITEKHLRELLTETVENSITAQLIDFAGMVTTKITITITP